MPRSTSSIYQIPSKNFKRRSEYYHQIAQNYDKRFTVEVMMEVTFQFVINSVITLLWMGLVIGIWANWGGGYKRFTLSKDYDCTLAKYFGILSMLNGVGDAFWTTTNQKENELRVPTAGLYAITSVINFNCYKGDSNHSFIHSVNTSNGKCVQDKIELEQSVDENGILCYRSFIFATFQMDVGDHFRVQARTKHPPRYEGSHFTYYRVRDPLRCPRRFVDPIINKRANTVIDNRSIKAADQFFGQKVFRGEHYWWREGYLRRWNCEGRLCEGVGVGL